MAYTKYTTEAIVMGRMMSGEGNAIMVLLTKDFGLIHAAARSVRLERSRLRYSLQTGGWSDVSLVRGRHEWRLVSARERESLPVPSTAALKNRALMVRLIRRLVVGQDQNSALYTAALEALQALSLPVTAPQAQALEALVAARIVMALGYVRPNTLAHIHPVLMEGGITLETIHAGALHREALVAVVNDALAASQL